MPDAGVCSPGYHWGMAKAPDRSGNIWILVPLAALMIPIIAIAGNNPVFWAIFAMAVVLGGGTLAARNLMSHRHELRMAEIEAQAKVMAEERAQLEVANRILDADVAELRSQFRAQPPTPTAGPESGASEH